HVIGWTVLKPGARHERHRHHNCDEFFIVIKGRGHIYSDLGEEPSVVGDVVYSPRGCWHGFNNTSNEDVVLAWGWMGAGSIEDSGYEVDPTSHKSSACMNLSDDPRVVRGMTAQLALRRRRLDSGDMPLGWKVGFGAPAQLKQFNIAGPLVGFLTQNARIAPGGTVALTGWTKPVAEPE